MSNETPAVETAAPAKRDWRADVRDTFAAIPHKPVFGLLLLAWVLLFIFLGNSTQGYVRTPNLFGWLTYAYDMKSDDYHGYLVPFVVLGLLWWKRRELAQAPKRVWWPALAFVAFGLAVHMLGFLIQQNRISVVGFYVGVWGLVGVVWGPVVMGKTFFPVFLFAFCLPLASVTDTLTLPLRKAATFITVKFCHVLSIGVQQVGTNMVDPKGRYQYDVAAACSGIRSLTAICALTSAYAFVFFTKTWKRAIVLCLAVPLAVVSNVLRLFTIVVASEVAASMGRDPEKAGHFVHDSTWISMMPYIIAFVGVLLAGRWLKEDRDVDILDVALPVGVSLGIFFVLGKIFPIEREHGLPGGAGPWVAIAPAVIVIAAMFASGGNVLRQLTRRGVAAGLVTLALIGLSAAVLVERRAHQRLTAPGVKLSQEAVYAEDGTNKIHVSDTAVFLPQQVERYKSEPIPLSRTVAEWLPPDTTYGQRRYTAPDGFWVDTMVVLMGSDRTSIHNPRYCLPAQDIQIVGDERDTIRVERPVAYDLPVTKLRLIGKGRTKDGSVREFNGFFVYWFVSDTKVSAEHGKRMWETSRDLLRTGVMERWAYVICMTFFEPGEQREAAAYARLKDFIRDSVPQFQTTTGAPAAQISQAGK